MPIADFHTHTTLKYYASSHPNNKKIKLWDEYIPNCSSRIYNELKNIEALKEVSSSTQSDFINLAEGNSVLNYIVLGQLEAGFTRIEFPSNNMLFSNLNAWFGIIGPLFAFRKQKLKFIECISGVSFDKLMFLNKKIESKGNYDSYFEEFKKEVEYILTHVNKSFLSKNGKNITVRLPNDKNELTQFLNESNSNLILIFAIEGIQAIGKIGKIRNNDLKGHLQHYKEAINFLRIPFSFEGKTYSIKPFYISPAHHFPNFLFGHSKTLSGTIGNLLEQEINPKQGISKEGIEILDALLFSINGKRIFIDIKHFSVQSRKDYYKYLDLVDPDKTIPVICSHTGITNTSWERLDDSIPDDNESKNNYFLDWNINLYYEELLIISERDGLIGIQLDEKRIGDGFFSNSRNLTHAERVLESEKLLLANILVIVRTIKDKKAWDLICIGSDFDGLINSLDNAANTKSLPALKLRLTEMIDNPILSWDLQGLGINKDLNFILTQHEIENLKYGLTGEEIMEKIFWTNLKEFTLIHF
jgi:hypothetical protein